MLEKLILEAKERRSKVIVRDFNALASECRSSLTEAEGYSLEKAFAKLDIILAENYQVNMKRGVGSVVDLVLVSLPLARDIFWKVTEHYTHSDHQGIALNRRTSQAVGDLFVHE